MRKDKPMGKRNPIAKAMLVSREVNAKPKAFKNKKAYSRKDKTRHDPRDGSYSFRTLVSQQPSRLLLSA